jgi:hypothetical protein
MEDLKQFLKETLQSLKPGSFSVEQRSPDGYVDILPFCLEKKVDLDNYLIDKFAQVEIKTLKSSSNLKMEELIEVGSEHIWVYPELAYDFVSYIEAPQSLLLGSQLIKWFETQVLKTANMSEAAREQGDLDKVSLLVDDLLDLKRRAEILQAKMQSTGRAIEQTIKKAFSEFTPEHYNEKDFVRKETENSSTLYKRIEPMCSKTFAVGLMAFGIPSMTHHTIHFSDGTVEEFFSDDVEAVKKASTKARQDYQEVIQKLDKKGYVYFILNTETGHIKVGYSIDPEQRLEDLQAANSSILKIIKTIEGTVGLERQIHKRFKHLRLHGEWFRAAPELMKYIRSL